MSLVSILWKVLVVILGIILPLISYGANIILYVERKSIYQSLYEYSTSEKIKNFTEIDFSVINERFLKVLPDQSNDTIIGLASTASTLIDKNTTLSTNGTTTSDGILTTVSTPTSIEVQNQANPTNITDPYFTTRCLPTTKLLKWQKAEYLQTSNSLKSFNQNLTSVIEPLMIIGTVLSLGLSMFLKVTMLTKRLSNLKSGIATVILCSSMQVLLSIVFVSNATYRGVGVVP